MTQRWQDEPERERFILNQRKGTKVKITGWRNEEGQSRVIIIVYFSSFFILLFFNFVLKNVFN